VDLFQLKGLACDDCCDASPILFGDSANVIAEIDGRSGQSFGLYLAEQFPFDRLVKFYDFSETNKAIADAKRGDTIKPVLRMGEV